MNYLKNLPEYKVKRLKVCMQDAIHYMQHMLNKILMVP